jgi:hypothetical protein
MFYVSRHPFRWCYPHSRQVCPLHPLSCCQTSQLSLEMPLQTNPG